MVKAHTIHVVYDWSGFIDWYKHFQCLDQILGCPINCFSVFRSAPGHAEGSEIRFEAIEAEEAGARDRVVRRDADESPRVEDEGEDEEEDESEEEEARPDGSGPGQVVGDSGGEEGDGQVFFGFGIVGRYVVVFGVRVRCGSARREDTLQHFGWVFLRGRREWHFRE